MAEAAAMGDTTKAYEPSAGLWYAVAGVALFAGGGLLLVGAEEPHEAFLMLGMTLVASGLYLLVVGAVARGTQLARLSAGARTSEHPDSGPTRQPESP